MASRVVVPPIWISTSVYVLMYSAASSLINGRYEPDTRINAFPLVVDGSSVALSARSLAWQALDSGVTVQVRTGAALWMEIES